MHGKTKILFDGNCVVCDLEISHYKRIAPDKFDLVDISSADFDSRAYKLSQQDVEKNLHVITASGELKVGVEAFAQIWSVIPKYSFGAKLIRTPGIYQIANLGYWFFTVIRPYLPKKT